MKITTDEQKRRYMESGDVDFSYQDETGHLVLATLQTCGAVQAVERILDMFPAHRRNRSVLNWRSRLKRSLRSSF